MFTPVHINTQNTIFEGCGEDPDKLDNKIPASKDTSWYAKVTSKYILTSQDIVLLNYADEGYEGQNQNLDWSNYIIYEGNSYYLMDDGIYTNLIEFRNSADYFDIVWGGENSSYENSRIYTGQRVENNTDENIKQTLHMVRFNDKYGGKSCMLQGNIKDVLKLTVDENKLTWGYGEDDKKIIHFGIFKNIKNAPNEYPAHEEQEINDIDIEKDISITLSTWDMEKLSWHLTKLDSAVNGRWYLLSIQPSSYNTRSTYHNSVMYIYYRDYKVSINLSHEAEHKSFNYSFMYSKKAMTFYTSGIQLMNIGDKYIWVEEGNDISGISNDIGEGFNFNTAFGTGLRANDLYSKNTNYYTPGGSNGIQTTPTPHAYTYNGSYLSGKTMDYGKKYYLWFKRTTQTPNTWQKSQFYIDFKNWIYANGSTLTFIIKDNANVIPTTSKTLP